MRTIIALIIFISNFTIAQEIANYGENQIEIKPILENTVISGTILIQT